ELYKTTWFSNYLFKKIFFNKVLELYKTTWFSNDKAILFQLMIVLELYKTTWFSNDTKEEYIQKVDKALESYKIA
ncbi:hypothetical protein, partial [Enterococcus faecium]|uniref:hypothetical protein n=1 Tax=Enterococcus faecium TaxID=1352 RepID=UPI0005340CB7